MQLARRPRRAPRIALTSLVDVVFILLFFFMLASRFNDWRALPIDLAPVAQADPAAQPASVVVLLMPDGGLRLRGAALALHELPAVAARIPGQTLVLVPARGTSVQQLVDVLDVLAASSTPVRLGHPGEAP